MTRASSVPQPSVANAAGERRRPAWTTACLNQLRAATRPPQGPQSPVLPLVTAAIVALVLLTLPTAPPDLGVDTGWCAVLRWAHETGARFGRELVFTYGPLGYLIAPYFVGGSTTTLALVNAALVYQIAAGLCLLAWRLAPLWRGALLIGFILAAGNAEPRADLALETGCFAWGLLAMTERGRRGGACSANWVGLLAFAALAKVTYLFVAAFSVVAIGLFLAIDGRARKGAAVVFGLAGILALGWVACGQRISDLDAFLVNGYSISRYYDQALGMEGLPRLRSAGWFLGLVTAGAILLRLPGLVSPDREPRRWKHLIAAAWACGMLFIVWKHSLVRLDRSHFAELLAFAPVVAAGLLVFPDSGGICARVARPLASACCVGAIVILQYAFLPSDLTLLTQPLRLMGYHIRCLAWPRDWGRALEPDLLALKRDAQLPEARQLIGSGTVDVFGSFQSTALFNGLNYRPRPVFQSYAAYSSRLADLNASYYASERAPDYVLFELSALDRRFPALNDGPALRMILANYKFAGPAGRYLVLKRKPATRVTLRLVNEGATALGERIELDRDAATWLEVFVQPNWKGRLHSMLLQPAPLRLAIWSHPKGTPEKPRKYRAATSLLGIGFLASPCLENSKAAADCLAGGAEFRPSAYSVEPEAATAGLWEPGFKFRIYRIIQAGPPQ
jgi:hypothetical protein